MPVVLTPGRAVRITNPLPAVVVDTPRVRVQTGIPATTRGPRGEPGEQGPQGDPGVGLREVYLDDETVPPGVPAWLRITRDETGAVTGVYYGEA